MTDIKNAKRPEPDLLLKSIADYVLDNTQFSEQAYSTARYCLLDSLGCALLALDYPQCTKLLGPIVSGAEMKNGVKVPGLNCLLDPVQAAFNIGTMIRWLDYNDTWLAAEWGHPSDNLGGILSAAQYLENTQGKTIVIRNILDAMIKAYEIQGILALNNSFNRIGLDHVILVRIATTAVVTWMLGGNKQQIINALSNAWLDGGALRTYRHAPNTGSRKSWAAGDATSRGVWHAINSLKNEMGYPSALTASHWGFEYVMFDGQNITLARELDSYVMENILFKVSFPAEFHAQTAVEAAMELHPLVIDRINEIDSIQIETQEAGVRIIDKTGPLNNPADRDHCLQYMVAIPLLFGRLTAADYEDDIASIPEINKLREKMTVIENKQFSNDYLDPAKRAIPNAITIKFKDATALKRIQVDYPLGHRLRRDEAIPYIKEKFRQNSKNLPESNIVKIASLFDDLQGLLDTPLNKLIDLFG